MDKSIKIILGILSFIPVLVAAIYLSSIFNMIAEVLVASNGTDSVDIQNAVITIFLMVIGILITLALIITYGIFVIRDQSATENDKILWVVFLLLLHVIAIPLFWYFRIWNNKEFRFEQSPTNRSN